MIVYIGIIVSIALSVIAIFSSRSSGRSAETMLRTVADQARSAAQRVADDAKKAAEAAASEARRLADEIATAAAAKIAAVEKTVEEKTVAERNAVIAAEAALKAAKDKLFAAAETVRKAL
jgi:hypothetical protein